MTIKEVKIQLALGVLPDDDKLKLAYNPNTPIEILTKLSEDKDWWIIRCVANNPYTSTEILVKLSTNGNGRIRYCANKNLSNR